MYFRVYTQDSVAASVNMTVYNALLNIPESATDAFVGIDAGPVFRSSIRKAPGYFLGSTCFFLGKFRATTRTPPLVAAFPSLAVMYATPDFNNFLPNLTCSFSFSRDTPQCSQTGLTDLVPGRIYYVYGFVGEEYVASISGAISLTTTVQSLTYQNGIPQNFTLTPYAPLTYSIDFSSISCTGLFNILW
jgi:hypothetical protein